MTETVWANTLEPVASEPVKSLMLKRMSGFRLGETYLELMEPKREVSKFQ